MPGAHVDKVYQAALDKIYYTPLTDEQKLTATPEALKEDARLSNNASSHIGTEVFKQIEASDLTAQEKQEVHLKLVQNGVQRELDQAINPATLLRGNSRLTNYMSGYMNHYAKEYMNSIYETSVVELAKVTIPESLKGKTIGAIGSPIPGATQQDLAKLEDTYVHIGGKIIEASQRNLALLSPEARKFMESALDPARRVGNSKGINMATASTLLLRGASGPISGGGGYLRGEDETAQLGQILVNSNTVAQSYANNINIPSTEKLGDEKPQNRLAERLRTKENLDLTLEAYKSVSLGSDAIDDFTEEHGQPLSLKDLDKETRQKVSALNRTVYEGPARNAIKNARVEPQLAELALVEKKIDDLRKPWHKSFDSFKAHMKAAFNGGKEKALNQLTEQADQLKMEVFKKVEPETFAKLQKQNQETIEGLKSEIETHQLDHALYEVAALELERLDRAEIQQLNLEKSGLPAPLSQEQREVMKKDAESMRDVMKDTRAGYQTVKQHQGEVENLEKNTKVRDLVGEKAVPKNAPKQGTGIKGSH